MRSSDTTRAPSPCSISSLTGEFEDTVSLPSTDSENDITSAPSSGLRTLVAQRNGSLEDCTYGKEKKSHPKAEDRKTVIEYERDPKEEPKLIWTKSRKRAFCYFLSLHFVPVAITVVLFWLYLEGFQWRANDIQLKTLLFAAKLHESLIMISLADILFHRIRYQLLTGRGISFGLLVSPFRVATPFSIFQTPFLASAKFTFKSGPELVTILLVVLASVLALLAAPSSGVLMLPRYDWWQIPKDDPVMVNFTKLDLGSAAYIRAPYNDLFPSLIDDHFARNLIAADDSKTQTLSNRIEQLISGLDRVLVDGSLRGNANITVLDGATVDAFGLAYQEETTDNSACEFYTCKYFAKEQNVTLESVIGDPDNQDYGCTNIICQSIAVQSTSPLALITHKLFDRYRTWMPASSSMNMIQAQALDVYEGRRTWRQPSVSVQCTTAPHDGLEELHFHHFGSFPPFSISPDRQLRHQIETMKPRGGAIATYMNITHLLPVGITVSTSFLMQGDRSGKFTNNATYFCLVDARWIESDVWYPALYASVMRSGISLESVQAITGSNETSGIDPVINITPGYANSLDTNLTVSSIYINGSATTDYLTPFEFIQRYCHMRVADDLQPKCAMLAHALYLTDSLRRTQSSFGYFSEGSDFWWATAEKSPRTKLEYRVYHQLHA